MSETVAPDRRVTLGEIFRVFLLIGATSFGGGVVAYLREHLVVAHRWLDEDEFLSALEISQTLPGLNATNMSVLVGDRLRGTIGAVVALLGMTLPGTIVMFTLGILYGQHSHRPMVGAALAGVAAAAVGLLLATTIQIGRRELSGVVDLVLMIATCLAISVFHWSLLTTLGAIAPLAILWYRPRSKPTAKR